MIESRAKQLLRYTLSEIANVAEEMVLDPEPGINRPEAVEVVVSTFETWKKNVRMGKALSVESAIPKLVDPMSHSHHSEDALLGQYKKAAHFINILQHLYADRPVND